MISSICPSQPSRMTTFMQQLSQKTKFRSSSKDLKRISDVQTRPCVPHTKVQSKELRSDKYSDTESGLSGPKSDQLAQMLKFSPNNLKFVNI